LRMSPYYCPEHSGINIKVSALLRDKHLKVTTIYRFIQVRAKYE